MVLCALQKRDAFPCSLNYSLVDEERGNRLARDGVRAVVGPVQSRIEGESRLYVHCLRYIFFSLKDVIEYRRIARDGDNALSARREVDDFVRSHAATVSAKSASFVSYDLCEVALKELKFQHQITDVQADSISPNASTALFRLLRVINRSFGGVSRIFSGEGGAACHIDLPFTRTPQLTRYDPKANRRSSQDHCEECRDGIPVLVEKSKEMHRLLGKPLVAPKYNLNHFSAPQQNGGSVGPAWGRCEAVAT
jgi:hypothetical protein